MAETKIKFYYLWAEDTNDFHKERGESTWTLNLFGQNGAALPFLNRQRYIAPHQLEIITFNPRPHDRPYRQEKISESPDTITYKKIFFTDYAGNVDAELGLLWNGGADAMGRGSAYFLNGEFKDAFGASDDSRFKTPEEFKAYLTEYFKSTARNFGTHLGSLIINSNLPDIQRKAVGGLIE